MVRDIQIINVIELTHQKIVKDYGDKFDEAIQKIEDAARQGKGVVYLALRVSPEAKEYFLKFLKEREFSVCCDSRIKPDDPFWITVRWMSS